MHAANPIIRDGDRVSEHLVLVSEFMADSGLALLESGARLHYDPELYRSPECLLQLATGASALVVRNRTPTTAELFQAAPRLQVVGRLGTGLDNIDLEAAERAGIRVVYAAGANTVSTAEFTFALVLALAKRIPAADWSVREGGWNRQEFTGIELAGKTLGILGLGRVGLEVAARARAFKMGVAAFHPRKKPDDPALAALGIQLVDLTSLLRMADFLCVHLPGRPENRDFIGIHELRMLKPSCYLVNTARGGVVNEEALFLALKRGWLAGAALDVRRSEPPDPDDPFTHLPNVLLTPHVAGLTSEAGDRVSLQVAQDILRVLAGHEPLFPIPAPSLAEEQSRANGFLPP